MYSMVHFFLSSDFNASHKAWCFFHLVENILKFLLRFLLWLVCYLEACCLISMFLRIFTVIFVLYLGLPGDACSKEPICQCRRCKRHRFNPWLGRSPGVRNGNMLQYSCLGNSTDSGAWWATVHGARKSWMRLSAITSILILLWSESRYCVISILLLINVVHFGECSFWVCCFFT